MEKIKQDNIQEKEEDQLLAYHHRLCQARMVADDEGRQIIETELSRIKKKVKKLNGGR